MKVSPFIENKYEFDLWLEVATEVRKQWLRSSPNLETDSKSLSSASRLAPVCCGIDGCQWKSDVPDMTLSNLDRKEDHPWDALLRLHVEDAHGDAICNIAKNVCGEKGWRN